MQYGFVIDNRKCIGCHACTTACKQEHDVPLGVFRTWVKQVEKGQFPNTRRVFSVMRCNHCTDAPCVEICPTEALHIRPDGIVDFDKNRCIGCKSCMQACPYDALYIDPDTQTAAKCNYCAHRVDVGLEPACVNVCPEHAIISGDLDNPETEIAQLLAREPVTARKTEKGTRPNLFYIDGDYSTMIPIAVSKPQFTALTEQTRGVGHFAKQTERLAYDGDDLIQKVLENSQNTSETPKSIDLVLGDEMTKRYYDAPDKGILWGKEVWSYVFTKAISTGAFLVPFGAWLAGRGAFLTTENWWSSLVVAAFFLAATLFLLVIDLDQPMRFVYVLLRPQWKSWLVRGGFALVAFSFLLAVWAAVLFFKIQFLGKITLWLTAAAAVVTAIYTAFLFAQAKGRDFWQSPMLAFHMLGHAIAAGAAALILVALFTENNAAWLLFLGKTMGAAVIFNLAVMAFELTTTHPTDDARLTVSMIWKGFYKNQFWLGAVGLGAILPLGLLFLDAATLAPFAAMLVLAGVFITEKIWVEAPQRVPLS